MLDCPSDPLSCLSTDWIRIASDIELNYSNFDGFVVLHGTDTMSYTSSALSFMLEDLGKTVVRLLTPSYSLQNIYNHLQVVTGAQIPMSQLRNDAVDNLLGALVIAGHYIIPGKLRCLILPTDSRNICVPNRMLPIL